LLQPFTWEALKRALKTGVIKIESAAEQMSLASTVSLDPDPIPLSVKVVLVGERQLYYTLAEFDPDFPKLFKVQVDFEDEAERSPNNLALFARFVAAVVRDWGLRPVDAAAVARLSDEASRQADDNERLSLGRRRQVRRDPARTCRARCDRAHLSRRPGAREIA
jgi:predicted ATP-dependent protease